MSNVDPNILEKFEQISGMKSTGYVFDFSNSRFSTFIQKTVGVEIYDEIYNKYGDSKAKRLRTFWEIENDDKVIKLLLAFLDYWMMNCDHSNSKGIEFDKKTYDYLVKKLNESIEQQKVSFSVFSYKSISKEAEMCLMQAKDIVESGQPEGATDRVHTFAMNFVRSCLSQLEESYLQGESLDSLYNRLKRKVLDTYDVLPEFENMFKSSSAIFSSLNNVRNKKSLAHDNEIISPDEAIYLIENVMSILKYLNFLINS